MERTTLALGLLCAGAAASAGCATATDLDANAPVGTITTALDLGTLADGDVTGVRFDVVGADAACDGKVVATDTRALESEALPASLAGTAGAQRPFADALFVLEPGEYRVCATPLAGDVPSARCAPADMLVEVTAGATNEVVLIAQCGDEGSGGLDVIVALNEPPRITAVTLDPSKFITVCESLAISAMAEDPNGDAVEYGFALTAGPDGAALIADGAKAAFSGPAGDYAVTVTATDVHGNASSLAFPIHVSDATCAVPQAVQGIFAASCSPCHTTGSSGGLSLATAEASHANLIERNAVAGACAERVLVVPGEPAESYLIGKLRGAGDICGLPMPRNRPALPEEQIQAIEAWIAGLPR